MMFVQQWAPLGPFRQPIQQLIDDDRQVRSWPDHRADK